MFNSMRAAGVIVTYIDWSDIKELPFNIALFTFQLLFLVVGKILGKVEVEWGEIWHAAQASHVRLCLRKSGLKSSKEWAKIYEDGITVLDPDGWDRTNFRQSWNEKITEAEFKRRCSCSTVCGGTEDFHLSSAQSYDYINFGYPKAEIQYWRIDQCKGQFEYRDPTFPTPPEFMEPVIRYAEDQVGKKYDELQLISSGLHLIAWIVMPWCWGKELKIIKALNRKGGLEDCISGVTACLRWGERDDCPICRKNQRIVCTNFFKTYDTAMVSPCLIAIDRNWRKE